MKNSTKKFRRKKAGFGGWLFGTSPNVHRAFGEGVNGALAWKIPWQGRDIKAELATVIGIITESNHIVEQAAEQEGGFINMCGALERLEKRGIEQGKKEVVLQMLRKGMDRGLIREITGMDGEAIEKLRKEMQMKNRQ